MSSRTPALSGIVISRFRNQTRTTALPEEPILRIYPVGDKASNSVERKFH